MYLFLQDCLRGLLAVLMNTTQNNAPGCARVVGVGGMEGAAQTLVKITLGGPHMKGMHIVQIMCALICLRQL